MATDTAVADVAADDEPQGTFEDATEEAIEGAAKPKRRNPNEPSEVLDSSIGWSDEEDAHNFAAMLTMVRIQTGNINVAYEVRFRSTPEFVGEIAEIYGDQTFTATFADKLVGKGAVIASFRGGYDADGNKYIEFILKMPESEFHNAPNIMGMVKKAGTLALVPDQLSFDLTKKAE